MATLSNPPSGMIVNANDAPNQPPPLLQTGMFAWLRENLFKSTFDTILTVVAGGISLALIVSIITWSVSAANWFVITQNLQQILVGTFPREQLWRVNAAALACAFALGFTLYAYTRLRRVSIWALGVLVAVVVVAPMLIRLTTPLAPTYLAAGEVTIAAGTQTEVPQSVVGFVGRAGETVIVAVGTFAPIRIDADGVMSAPPPDDAEIVTLAGFADRAASAVVNAAAARLNTIATITDIDARLAGDLLTANQRAGLTDDRDGLEVPPVVTEVYGVNRAPVDAFVRVVNADGTIGDVIASATLDDPADVLEAVLPADSWYVLEKATAEGVAILRATGIYPVLERNLSQIDDAGGSTRVSEYARLTDRYETRARRPQIDGANVPLLVITDAQYRGTKPLPDYLRLYLAPFLDQFSTFLLPMLIVGIVGYFGGMGVGVLGRDARSEGQRVDMRRPARAFTSWLWILYFFALAFLVYGVAGLDALGVALLLGRFAWVGWAYYAGANARHAWGRAALGLVFALGLAQAVIAERIDLSQPFETWLWKIVGVLVWLGVGVLAAQRGASMRERIGNAPSVRGFVGASGVWLFLLIVPVMVLSAANTTNDLLPITDTNRWGGLLLTMLLTLVSVVASFPLGVLLALGRRSSLPVVKGTCIAFIELVRGVPLITVLFMAQLLVPLVNPALADIENVFRAMVGLTLFSAAYLAENVRGGLQSVAGGQEEAARALGLTGWQITLFVTLPQALRAVIPALVGQFISLFKDTSLVALVGLLDLTGMARSTIAQSEFAGLQSEIFFFTSILYFVFSYIMASISRRIEASGSGAARRTL
ncbi:MAG: amino acid ABC transporter permease [Chloroflexota bacterium]|nr:amino acid ABC transporter permease [Chloroflexota bacterium]